MKQTFTISGQLPSLNEYIAVERSNRYAAAKMKKDIESLIISYIRKSHIRPMKRVWVTYSYFEKSRRRDKDNIAAVAHKFTQDSLVKSGVLKNDNWDYIEGFTDHFEVDRKNPRVEITLEEV